MAQFKTKYVDHGTRAHTLILNETISVEQIEAIEVDPIILMDMRERLNPTKPFSYADGDHVKGQIENERNARKGQQMKPSKRPHNRQETFFNSDTLGALIIILMAVLPLFK